MGWISNLDDAENAINNGGILPDNQVGDIATPGANKDDDNNPYDVANIAWDLSSLNYDAEGMNGWANRLLGLSAVANPLAWASTISGVSTNEAAKNPNDNIFERAWKVATGTVWGLANAEFQGLGMVEKAAKAGFLQTGILADELADLSSGNISQQEGNVWDLSQTKDIGTGEAFFYTQSQLSRAASNALTGTESQLNKDIAGALQADWMLSDFNVFSKEDTDKFEQGGTAFITQPLNFAAEIALDPSTYLTFGASAGAKLLYKGAYGVVKGGITKNVLKQADELRVISAGEASDTATSIVVKELANNNSSFAAQTLKRRGMADGQRLQNMSWLLGKTKTEADAADVLLAFEHGDTNAMVRLTEKHVNDADFSLSLDKLNSGGAIARAAKDPNFYDTPGFDKEAFDAGFLEQLNKYSDDAINSNPDYIKAVDVIKSLSYDVVPTGKGLTTAIRGVRGPQLGTTLATDTYVGKVLPSIDKVFTQATTAQNKFITKIINDTPEATTVEMVSRIGLPRIISTIRKGTFTSARGYVNLNSMDEVATNKLISYIDEIDTATNKGLSSSGKTAEYMDKWRSSTSDVERYDIFTQLEREGINLLAAKHGTGIAGVNNVADELHSVLRYNQDKTVKNLVNRESNILDNTLEFDDVYNLLPENANVFQTLNFKQLDTGLKLHGTSLFNAYNISGDVKDAIRAFNGVWAFGVLFRPARYARERIASIPGIILSGQLVDMWFGKDIRKAYTNAVVNARTAFGRSIDLRKAKNELFDPVDGKRAANTLSARATVRHYGEEISRIDSTLAQLQDVEKSMQRDAEQLINVDYDNLSDAQKAQVEGVSVNKTAEEFYYGGNIPAELDNTKLFATTESNADANVYSRELYTQVEGNNISDIISAAGEGNNINVRLKGRTTAWSVRTPEELAEWSDGRFSKYEYAILPKGQAPSVKKYTVYGERLDLNNFDAVPTEVLNLLGVKSVDEYYEVISSGQFKNNQKFIEWLNKNDIYGKAVYKEADGKPTVLVSNKFIETDVKSKPVAQVLAKQKLDKGIGSNTKIDDTKNKIYFRNIEDVNNVLRDAEQVLKDFQYESFDLNLDDYATQMIKLRDQINELKSRRNVIDSRVSKVRKIIEGKGKSKESIFKGTNDWTSVSGHSYTIPNFSEGEDAIIPTAIARQGDVQRELLTNNNIATDVYLADTVSHTGRIEPSNSRYYESLAAWLTLRGKNDAAFDFLAKGGTKQDLIKWLSSDEAGRRYADNMKIGSKYTKTSTDTSEIGHYEGFEDYADYVDTLVNQQLYNSSLRNAYINNDTITDSLLREAMTGIEPQTVIGRLDDATKKTTVIRKAQEGMNKVNKLFVEDPASALENLPMVQNIYKKKYKELIDFNEAKAGGQRLSSEQEWLIRQEAYKTSIHEMRKWLYNVQSKTRLTEALSMVVPFITAYTFTNRMFLRGLKENPAAMYWMYAMGTRTVGALNYADAEGNPTDSLANAQSITLPINEEFQKALKGMPLLGGFVGDGKQVNISLKSLNVWYGGEVLPGPGPLITIPVEEIVRTNPAVAYNINKSLKEAGVEFNDEGLMETLLPFGVSDKPVIGKLLPTWTNNAIDYITQGKQYLATTAKVTAFEQGQFAMGLRDTPPTEDEILGKVNAMFATKFLVSTSSPAAFSVKTEGDMGRQVLNKYYKIYGEDAEWRFMSDYPELVGAMVSSTSNEYNLSAEDTVMNNIEKYDSAVEIFGNANAAGKDLMGWAMNSSKNPEFNDFAYDYLANQSAGAGADAYRTVLSPQEIKQKAAVKPAWVTFNKFMNLLDAEATSKGTTIEGNKRLSAYKTEFVKKMKDKFPEWYGEYSTMDRAKYNDRADTMEQLLTDEKWMNDNANRADVSAILNFVSMRKEVQSALKAEDDKLGGKGTLAANKNIKAFYDTQVLQLKSESVGFSEWYNRYFDGDTIV